MGRAREAPGYSIDPGAFPFPAISYMLHEAAEQVVGRSQTNPGRHLTACRGFAFRGSWKALGREFGGFVVVVSPRAALLPLTSELGTVRYLRRP